MLENETPEDDDQDGDDALPAELDGVEPDSHDVPDEIDQPDSEATDNA